MSAVGPVLPSLAEQTGSSLGAVSFFFTARSFGYLIGSLIAGRLFDRYAGHPILVASLLCIAIAFALIPIAAALIFLFLLAVLMGFSEAGVDLGTNSMLVWIHGSAVPPFMNGLHFFFGLGAFLAPLMFAQMVSAGWRSTAIFWAMAILVFIALAAVSRLPSPKNLSQGGKASSSTNAGGLVWLIVIGFFLYVGIEVGLAGWIYTYALAANLADAISAAYLTSSFWAAFTVGRFLGIPLSRRFSPSHMLAFNATGMVIGFAVLIFIPGPTALWTGVILAGFSMASCFPALMSFAGRTIPISARVTGWFFAGSSVGGMLVPWLIGQLFESGGPYYILIILGTTTGILAILFATLLMVSRKHLQAN